MKNMNNPYSLSEVKIVNASNAFKKKRYVTISIIFSALIILIQTMPMVAVTQEQIQIQIQYQKQSQTLKEEFGDPCENFYEFSCGKFASSKKNLIHTSYIMDNMEDFNDKLIEIINETRKSENLTEALKNFFIYYNSSENYELNETNRNEWKKNYFNKNLGGCPLLDENWNESTYNLEEYFAKFIKLSIFPFISVQPDNRNTERNIITILAPDIESQIKTNYFDSNKWINTRSLVTYYHVSNEEPDFMTIEELQEFIPEINWKKLFDYIFEDIHLPEKSNITSQTEIMIWGKKIKLLELFEMNKTESFESVLANFFCTSFSVSFPNEIDKTLFLDILSRYTNFLDYIYYQHVKYNKKNNLLEEITEYIHEFMSNSLSNKTWLDDETKIQINEKIKEMIITTDFPEFVKNEDLFMEFYKDFPNMNSNFDENFLNMKKFMLKKQLETLWKKNDRKQWNANSDVSTMYYSALYHPLLNKVVMTQFFQSKSMFNVNFPIYTNFARYGSALAHEITHSLTTNAIRMDGHGNLNMTWSEESLMEYNKRVECLVDQYGSYEIGGERMDGNRTIDENIADNSGLRHAYFAYKEYLKKYESEGKDILEDFQLYNPDQMFFISYATMWCDSETGGELKSDMNRSEHSPQIFRIIGTVSNMKEFSEAFQCGNDKPMNPVDKCILW
ncbi:endothelin-converting enzyme 1-like [Centruroides sculpturatus]|uniref:endothelin-converting enzyme 1-like n=1 Tax=Centruroides sculpturatus TaxID=218467 RepID=UPI000C6CD9E1|nr:endothelin-converting enzyme 1-like [Centruroides sculpturatus]